MAPAYGKPSIMWSSVTYACYNDGTHAIDHSGSLSRMSRPISRVRPPSRRDPPPPTTITPVVGLWWNPAEDAPATTSTSSTGAGDVDVHGSGRALEWYVAAGPLTDNGTKFTSTSTKYRGARAHVSQPAALVDRRHHHHYIHVIDIRVVNLRTTGKPDSTPVFRSRGRGTVMAG
jgi:hypothetical protein